MELKDKIPETINKRYGCAQCEWRGFDVCPVFQGSGQDYILPQEQICDKRKEWILMLTPHYTVAPTKDQWERDFNLAIGQERMLKEKHLYEHYNNQALKEQDHEKSISLGKKGNKHYQNWQYLWKELLKYQDLQVGREMPKKVEVTKKVEPSPSDVARMIKHANKEVIEVNKDGP